MCLPASSYLSVNLGGGAFEEGGCICLAVEFKNRLLHLLIFLIFVLLLNTPHTVSLTTLNLQMFER